MSSIKDQAEKLFNEYLGQLGEGAGDPYTLRPYGTLVQTPDVTVYTFLTEPKYSSDISSTLVAFVNLHDEDKIVTLVHTVDGATSPIYELRQVWMSPDEPRFILS